MPGSIIPVLRGTLLACVVTLPATAGAVTLCDALTVPDEIDLSCSVSPDGASADVVPTAGPFAAATRLTVWPLADRVEADDAWLRRQVTLDLSGVSGVMRGVVTSEDSPFIGSRFPDAVARWAELIESWGNLPLAGCGEPEDVPAYDARELHCVWRAGPLEQHLIVRLVHGPNGDYGMTARAMNPMRIRHLEAIANSFVPGNAT